MYADYDTLLLFVSNNMLYPILSMKGVDISS